MIKHLLVVLTVLLIASCESNNNKAETGVDKLSKIHVTDDSDIFGKWMMCSNSHNGTTYQRNVCPVIIFDLNGLGYVEKNSIRAEFFTWSLSKSSLNIIYRNSGGEITFPHKTYNAYFNKQQTNTDLFISHDGSSFYLTKAVDVNEK